MSRAIFAGVFALVLCSALLRTANAGRLQEFQQKLVHAVIQDQIDEVRTLLGKGSDPNARTPFGPEDRWFLDNRRDEDPAPPLIVLACRFMSIRGPEIIRLLIDKGANVNIADKNGVTPLMAASELGGAVPLLLEHKAKVNVADKSGKTPLMYAMNNRGLGTSETLLSHGADINARDNHGRTALMYAVEQAIDDPIRLIGEDRKRKGEEGQARYLELIRLLIERHADVSAKDKAGYTAMKLASERRQAEAVKLLNEARAKELIR